MSSSLELRPISLGRRIWGLDYMNKICFNIASMSSKSENGYERHWVGVAGVHTRAESCVDKSGYLQNAEGGRDSLIISSVF